MRTDLERTEELFSFLQGVIPEGYRIESSRVPQLSAEQAWMVILYLGNLDWQVTVHIERCDVCGCIYDSKCEGTCLDFGDAPYNFCDACQDGPEAVTKRRRARAARKRETKRLVRKRKAEEVTD